jgi:C1A family cysteine protease
LFIYYNARELIGSVNVDSGSMIRDGIKCLADKGYCSEATYPYIVEKFKKRPPKACYKEAASHKILEYYRMTSINELLKCLADGFPFVFGIALYQSFEGPEVAKTGIANLPNKEERMIGGHAVCAVGYTMKERRFIVRNSWGSEWGQNGYFTLPFEYVEQLADDFWTIKK